MNIYTFHNNFSSRQILNRIFKILAKKHSQKKISFYDFDNFELYKKSELPQIYVVFPIGKISLFFPYILYVPMAQRKKNMYRMLIFYF
jgi:hypothetical protein